MLAQGSNVSLRPNPRFLSFPSKLPIPPPPLPSFPPRFASVYKDACTNSVSQLPAYLQPRFNTGSQCTGFVQVTSLALCKHNKNDMLLCKMSTYWRHGRADQLFNDYAHIPPEALQVSLSKGAALHCKPHVPLTHPNTCKWLSHSQSWLVRISHDTTSF